MRKYEIVISGRGESELIGEMGYDCLAALKLHLRSAMVNFKSDQSAVVECFSPATFSSLGAGLEEVAAGIKQG